MFIVSAGNQKKKMNKKNQASRTRMGATGSRHTVTQKVFSHCITPMHTPKTFLYFLGYFSFDYLMHAQIDKTKTKHANQHDILKKNKTKRIYRNEQELP